MLAVRGLEIIDAHQGFIDYLILQSIPVMAWHL